MRFGAPLVLALAACAPPPPQTPDQLADRYAELARALGEHDPLHLDHVFAEEPVAESLPLSAIARRASRLLETLEERDDRRSRRLADGARALLARAERLLGTGRPAQEELWLVFGLRFRPHPRDPATLERLHAEVDRKLPGVAPLPVRIRRRNERIARHPPESLLREALALCRQRVPGFDGPPLRLRWSEDAVPFYRHRGGEGILSLSRRLPLGIPEARRLACHEGVPGHHFQAELAAAAFRETGFPELGIVPLHHPRTAVFEGLAAAAERLGAEPPPEAVLEPVALTLLADYLDGRMSRLDALRAFQFEALVPDPHAVLDHADRFGSYALVRPAADPDFAAAVQAVFAGDVEQGLRRAVREAMSPAELTALFSPR